MKYLLSLGLITLLVGCNHAPVQSSKDAQKNTSTQVASQQVINFVGPYDLTLTLISNDNFETATLTDNSDAQYHLKRTISANGIRMQNDKDVVIHFKATENGNQGYVELVKGKTIEIKEFKQN